MSGNLYNKFIVIKNDDLTKYVSLSRKAMLSIILDNIQEGRKAENKCVNNKYMVVNQDESYAPLVENLILNKVSVNDIPEKIKEEILKEYAEELFEEFQQIIRFEGSITLKDVTDVLQIGQDEY